MLRTRTSRLALALVVIDVALFVVSGIPRYKNANHGTDKVIGEIVWFGFLIGTLTLLVTLAVRITSSARRRRAAS